MTRSRAGGEGAGVTVLWSPRRLDYTGAELRSHFLLRQFGIEGDGLVAFTGACRVDPAHMRDLEDLLEGSAIAGDRMLHFLGEHFDRDLERMVLRQHLLAALAADEIGRRAGVRIERRGDDLWHRGRKLSISIATLTPVSAVLHFAVNVVTTGVPVRAAGLEELGVAPAPLARAILAAWRGELGSVRSKRCRVRGAP